MTKKYSVTVAAEESGWAAAPTGGTAEVTRAGIPGGCRGKAPPARSAKALLMDRTAVESAFALLLEKVTKEGLRPDTFRTFNVREGSNIMCRILPKACTAGTYYPGGRKGGRYETDDQCDGGQRISDS